MSEIYENILNVFDRQVKKTPHDIALEFLDQTISYSALDTLTDSFSQYLARKYNSNHQALKPPIIAIFLPRSKEMFISLLAILKSGAAYLPIDCSYPEKRVAYILEDSKADLIITNNDVAKKLPSHLNEKTVTIDDLFIDELIVDNNKLNKNISLDHTAYIIYTSGTTGKPKGVKISHRALAVLPDYFAKLIRPLVGDKVLQFSSLCFDASVFEWVTAFTSGATLCVIPQQELPPFVSITKTLSDKKINIALLPPNLLEVMEDENLNDLRVIVSGGAPCSKKLINKWSKKTRLINAYGPTEAAVMCLTHECKDGEAPYFSEIRTQNRLYILDHQFNKMKKGEVGELYIAGGGLADGYLSLNDLTSIVFLKDPFSQDGSLMYKTGDLFKIIEDAKYVYVGRVDDQVKVRGYRIELLEIQNTLAEHPNIRQCFVTTKGSKTEICLAAYYVADKYLASSEIEKFLEKELPQYMVPRVYFQVDELPLNLNGKIDKLKLIEKEEHQYAPQARILSKLEKHIFSIFQEVLNINEKDLHSNIFELGGNSLHVMQIITRISRDLSLVVTPEQLFSGHNLIDFCQKVGAISRSNVISDDKKILFAKRSKLIEATDSQKMIWLEQTINKENSHVYNEVLILKSIGNLDFHVLESALNQTIRENEILRTVFSYVQKRLSLKVIDNHELQLSIRKILKEDLNFEIESLYLSPFDLTQLPLFRACVFSINDEENYIVFIFNHIIIDGWSMRLFIKSLSFYYENQNYLLNDNIRKYDFLDYALWENEINCKKILESNKNESFWSDYLQGYQKLALVSDYDDENKDEEKCEFLSFELDKNINEQIKLFSAKYFTTPYNVFLAVFALTLSRYYSQYDMVIGTPAFNRQHSEFEDIMGCFVNSIPVRVIFDEQNNFLQLLECVKNSVIKVLEHQSDSFTKIVEWVNPERNFQHNPLFDLMFVFQSHQELQVQNWSGLELTRVNFEKLQSKFKLLLTICENKESYSGVMQFKSTMFDVNTIKYFVEIYKNLLTECLVIPQKKTAEMQLLSSCSELKIINQANPKYGDLAVLKPIYQQITTRATLTPKKSALIFQDTTISYEQLENYTNILAIKIREMISFDKNDKATLPVVGIFFERSSDMVIAILSAIKAGVIFVPLDPIYPHERINFIIKDSNMTVMLCHQKTLKEVDNFERIIALNFDEINFSLVSEQSSLPGVDICSPAYLIYTSGSTGKPKGVICTHQGLSNTFLGLQNDCPIKDDDRVLARTPLVFDVSLRELLWPLCYGASVVVLEDENNINPKEIYNAIKKYAVTRASFVPVLLNSFLNYSLANEIPCLRVVFCGGDILRKSLKEKFLSILPNVRLFNSYGPSEVTINSSIYECSLTNKFDKISIGFPLPGVRYYILGKNKEVLPPGAVGELYISSASIAKGYLNLPDLTHEKFINNIFNDVVSNFLYKTGDRVCLHGNGVLEILGRIDNQVKIHGLRIELEEIEKVINDYFNEESACVTVSGIDEASKVLTCYILDKFSYDEETLNNHLQRYLPSYMIPKKIIKIEKFPLLASGKIDRKQLPKSPSYKKTFKSSNKISCSIQEKLVLSAWKEILSLKKIALNHNFFDLGGNSLKLIEVFNILKSKCDKLKISDLFKYTTIKSLADYISGTFESVDDSTKSNNRNEGEGYDIAIIGIDGKFPGADNLDEFWQLLVDGKDCITREQSQIFSEGNTYHVSAHGKIKNEQMFDAEFFNYLPREAELMDPQQRQLLQVAYHALEDAGYPPSQKKMNVGVFVGVSPNSYLQNNILANTDLINSIEYLQISALNDKAATTLAYKFNLSGPALQIVSACSSSLAAVHSACLSLLHGDCSMSLAAGVSITCTEQMGYKYTRDSIMSKDGICRVFDQDSSGTVGGDGVGVVVLKRLKDAINDNDRIYAVIKGSAINNDGAEKIGFTAPSVSGQIEVIKKAIARAEVAPKNISYIEAHGTGTKLGDPIEFDALHDIFKSFGSLQTCGIGSVKANIGHLDSAAGIAGLIKIILMMQHDSIVPMVNFQQLNENIPLHQSPFYITTESKKWHGVKYAGVSSFGIGGTNAHVILKNYSPSSVLSYNATLKEKIFCLSARNNDALMAKVKDLNSIIDGMSEEKLTDLSLTLMHHREHFSHRLYFSEKNLDSIKNRLSNFTQSDIRIVDEKPKVIFLFPGQGAQFYEMGKIFYDTYIVFKNELDRCSEILKPILNINIVDVLYPTKENVNLKHLLHETWLTQPILFSFEYALAKLLEYFEIKPDIMLGHSLGEYVAACLSGVLTLQDALKMVAIRGKLMGSAEKGKMISVAASLGDLDTNILDECDVAAINSPKQIVLSGKQSTLDDIKALLEKNEINVKELANNGAFHSRLMDKIIDEFSEEVTKFNMNSPQIPYLSNLTGNYVDETNLNPDYWVRHVRQTVNFSAAFEQLKHFKQCVFIEVGPGRTMTSLAKHNLVSGQDCVLLNMIPSPKEKNVNLLENIYALMAKLWGSGVNFSYKKLMGIEKYERVNNVKYPFQEKKYWIGKLDGCTSNEKYGLQQVKTPNEYIIKEEKVDDQLQLLLINTLAGIVGSSEIKITDSFFDVGIHSLLATQFISHITKRIDINLGVEDIFNHPSVEQLSAYIYEQILSK